MKFRALLIPLMLTVSPSIAHGETWVCEYTVGYVNKLIQFERTPDGFKKNSTITKAQLFPIESETDERIVLIDSYSSSVFVVILDKKNSEFIWSGTHTPSQIRKAGDDPKKYRIRHNEGKCSVVK